MKIVCAYLLASLGGNTSPSSGDLKKILSSVGIEPDEERLELFMSQISGKSIEEVIACGRQKLASVPSGAGGGAAVSSATASAGGSAPAEPAKEEKKVEDIEESDDDMCISIFD